MRDGPDRKALAMTMALALALAACGGAGDGADGTGSSGGSGSGTAGAAGATGIPVAEPDGPVDRELAARIVTGWPNSRYENFFNRHFAQGGAGKLHAAFEVAGGNHILSREPAHGEPGNLKERIEIVGGDMWFEWYNTASEHKTFIGRYEPEAGSSLQGQQICTRFWNGSSSQGNALRIDNGALAADQAGRV